MPKLHLASQYLTSKYLKYIINDLRQNGVHIDRENRIKGVTYFQSEEESKVLQVVFLDLGIPKIVTKYLELVGGELRKEFLNSYNTHSHAMVFANSDFSLLTEDWKEIISKDYQHAMVKLKIVGVVALSRGEEVLLGLELEMDEFNKLRVRAGLSALETPHVTTTHMWRRAYERKVEPAVGRLFGRVDKYLEDWEDGRQGKKKQYKAEQQGGARHGRW